MVGIEQEWLHRQHCTRQGVACSVAAH